MQWTSVTRWLRWIPVKLDWLLLTCPEGCFRLLIHFPNFRILNGEHTEAVRILRQDWFLLIWVICHINGRHFSSATKTRSDSESYKILSARIHQLREIESNQIRLIANYIFKIAPRISSARLSSTNIREEVTNHPTTKQSRKFDIKNTADNKTLTTISGASLMLHNNNPEKHQI